MKGYVNNFLGDNYIIELPQPDDVLKADILQPPGLPAGTTVVPYIHYSLVMSRTNKQALYSAANVDLKRKHKVPAGKGRDWKIDKRVGGNNQLPNYPYQYSKWDRGHLTRLTAVTWHELKEDASKSDKDDFVIEASNESCRYTNATMQHENFNEDEWRAVEELVAKFKLADKLVVITGPIFTRCDRFFIRKHGDMPVRIPSAFWKIVSYVDSKTSKLSTQAYVFFQDIPSIKSTTARKRLELKNMQVTTTEIEHWTGLKFDKKMFDTNPLKFYNNTESIPTKAHLILNKDPNAVILNAGIVDEASIKAARSSIPEKDFLDMVKTVRWI